MQRARLRRADARGRPAAAEADTQLQAPSSLGALCLIGAVGLASLTVPAILWKRASIGERRVAELEARLAAVRAENARLEVALAEARADDVDRIAPVEEEHRMPVRWLEGGNNIVHGTLRPEVEAELSGRGR